MAWSKLKQRYNDILNRKASSEAQRQRMMLRAHSTGFFASNNIPYIADQFYKLKLTKDMDNNIEPIGAASTMNFPNMVYKITFIDGKELTVKAVVDEEQCDGVVLVLRKDNNTKVVVNFKNILFYTYEYEQ